MPKFPVFEEREVTIGLLDEAEGCHGYCVIHLGRFDIYILTPKQKIDKAKNFVEGKASLRIIDTQPKDPELKDFAHQQCFHTRNAMPLTPNELRRGLDWCLNNEESSYA